LTSLTHYVKLRVERVSKIYVEAGLTAAIITVFELPPRESCKK
jgi:hypothetical protein